MFSFTSLAVDDFNNAKSMIGASVAASSLPASSSKNTHENIHIFDYCFEVLVSYHRIHLRMNHYYLLNR